MLERESLFRNVQPDSSGDAISWLCDKTRPTNSPRGEKSGVVVSELLFNTSTRSCESDVIDAGNTRRSLWHALRNERRVSADMESGSTCRPVHASAHAFVLRDPQIAKETRSHNNTCS